MGRSRTTKQIAKRITLDYFKAPNAIRLANRVMIITLSLAALIYVGAFGMSRNSQGIYNPGPVSLAHASFQNDCASCHDGGSSDPQKAGFNLAVSDTACLKCHDGPVHHHNQNSLLMTTSMGQLVSSSCVTCHVEHRGHDALAGVSSRHCTQCHENLDANSKNPASIAIARNVTEFASSSHPDFGRLLIGREDPKKLVDPTPLAFNHAKHMELYKDVESIQNCYGCHSATGVVPGAKLPGAADTATTSKTPPWRMPEDVNPLWMKNRASLAWTASGDHRYMGPVNYQRACVECHRMELVPGLAIPHESMDTVRAALPQYALQVSQSRQKFAAQLEEELKKNPNFLTRPGPPPLRRPITTTKEQWIDDQMKPVLGNVARWSEQDAASKPGWPEKFKGVPITDLMSNPEALQFYAAYSPGGCVKCHQVTVEGGQDGAPVKLATAPTGISSLPRRWFVNSQFDHDAHRNQSCLDCHGQAKTSALTSDVLMPAMSSCTSCHHTPTTERRGAGSACVTCHVYHDRTAERTLLLPAKTVAGAPPTQPAAQ